MPWTRASELDRSLVCLASTILPRDPDTRGEGAAWGVMVHRWKATGLVRAEPEHRNHEGLFRKKLAVNGLGTPELEAEFREEWWPGGGRHEIGVAMDCKSSAWAQVAGTDESLEEWKTSWPESWVTGTLDYVADLLDDPWVDDLKTGREAPSPDSAQLLFYGLATARLWSVHRSWMDRVVLSVTHWPRYPVVGLPTRTWTEIDAATLDSFEMRLKLKWGARKDALDRARGKVERGTWRAGHPMLPVWTSAPVTVPGEEQCRWCKSRGSCPGE